MRIAIIGTRGIPNNYGGFEQLAENLSVGLVKKGHEVWVYNVHFHSYKQSDYKGVKIVKKYSFEKIIGSAANLFYDYLSLRDAINRKADIVLACGYQSTAIWLYILNINKTIIFTNTDGMEWWRAKWSPMVKKLTHWFEKLAAKKSHYLISDNEGIREYFLKTYQVDSFFIPYGAYIFDNPDINVTEKYNLKPYQYHILVARLEPENNTEMILEGFKKSTKNDIILVVGNHSTKYGKFLKNKYGDCKNIIFNGGIYNQSDLYNLRYFSKSYFHGHSVGGSPPSLLEAMGSSSFIISLENIFNRSVLNDDAIYFKSSDDIAEILENFEKHNINKSKFINNNLEKVKNKYTWQKIIDDYEKAFIAGKNKIDNDKK